MATLDGCNLSGRLVELPRGFLEVGSVPLEGCRGPAELHCEEVLQRDSPGLSSIEAALHAARILVRLHGAVLNGRAFLDESDCDASFPLVGIVEFDGCDAALELQAAPLEVFVTCHVLLLAF